MRYREVLAQVYGAIENNKPFTIEAPHVDAFRQCMGIPRAGETTFNQALNIADNPTATPTMLRNAILSQAALIRGFCDLAEEAQAQNNCTAIILNIEGEKVRYIATDEAALADAIGQVTRRLYGLGFGLTDGSNEYAFQAGATEVLQAIREQAPDIYVAAHEALGEYLKGKSITPMEPK